MDGDGLNVIVRTEVLPVQGPFVNRDAHIPVSIRVPPTAPYLLGRIRSVSPPLGHRPSDLCIGGSHIWNCPHGPCAFALNLVDISPAAQEIIVRVAGEDSILFVQMVDGVVSARPEFIREVVDFVALDHYENTHLARLDVHHVVHGLRADGRVRSCRVLSAPVVVTDTRSRLTTIGSLAT